MFDKPRIVIADDNPAMLETVSHLLRIEYQVIASLQEGRTVLDQVPILKPDILVLDVSMGKMNGFEITRQLNLELCKSKIIFLTVHEELEFIRAAFDAGASGYVFKSRMNKDLGTAINAVQNGKVFIPEAPIPQYDCESTMS